MKTCIACGMPMQKKADFAMGDESMLHSLSAQVSYYSQLIQSTPGWVYVGVYLSFSK